jgi:hypothetical protein
VPLFCHLLLFFKAIETANDNYESFSSIANTKLRSVHLIPNLVYQSELPFQATLVKMVNEATANIPGWDEER